MDITQLDDYTFSRTTPNPNQIELELQVNVNVGDLLAGCKQISSSGIDEWFDFPRYKVVALHEFEPIMFLETLNPVGEKIGVTYMDIKSEQWKHYGVE